MMEGVGESRMHTVTIFVGLSSLINFFFLLEIDYIMFLVPVILVRRLIAAFQVTSDLSCHEGIRGEGLVVAMTEKEHEEIEDAGEGRPTEEDGNRSLSYTKLCSNTVEI